MRFKKRMGRELKGVILQLSRPGFTRASSCLLLSGLASRALLRLLVRGGRCRRRGRRPVLPYEHDDDGTRYDEYREHDERPPALSRNGFELRDFGFFHSSSFRVYRLRADNAYATMAIAKTITAAPESRSLHDFIGLLPIFILQ